jgi:methylglutaconyl-CoA hydratase
MTSPYETIRLETDSRGVARLTLDRAERHNAFNSAMIRELTEAARSLAEDGAARVVVLRAAGASFCAGGDLAWMRAQFAAARSARMAEAAALAAMLTALDELPKPAIAVVEGPAYGGGVGLTAVCDIVLAGPRARFALTETRLGLIPANIAPPLIRRIGIASLRRLALTAAPFSAEEALRIGLVSELHDAEALEEAVERHIGRALACAPGAIAAAKRLFRRIAVGEATPLDTVEALADRWESEEARHGIAAFFDSKQPPWVK